MQSGFHHFIIFRNLISDYFDKLNTYKELMTTNRQNTLYMHLTSKV